MKKLLLTIVLFLALPSMFCGAQQIDKQKLASLSVAISHAEGFGVRHTIPSRYHNPGDLKSYHGLTPLPGQKQLGKGDHIIFRSDAAGWAALNDYIAKMVDGRSRHFNPRMTFKDAARVYAVRWHPWVNMVTKELGIPASTTLGDYLLVPEPPVLNVRYTRRLPDILIARNPVLPVLVEN